ncbi:type VI secretion system baseplate subunit TssG [Caballeronia sp. LZ034LL]|uniref:type VI secretion system baseplate subunit TssG n=1 Tax=Caballeronia sp. LZ034LL TaxID=3038567 RepID=UPI0028572DD9|nr:type VI secretion system baseplate subunit TssG [Caballeronia sp. LZ034LL]MDR5837103.1 type VI secretion system baseplate subunit TssG [Caballeronia sp. LZ034LL]
MDAAARSTSAALDDALFNQGERFGYFQAVRLLRRRARLAGDDPERLRVRPRLALGFPETDIDGIERDMPRPPAGPGEYDEDTPAPRPTPRITANFFGLYGVSSPLPTFYTEDLLEEAREGRTGMREFLDILHYTLYPLLYESWIKYRPHLRVVEEGDESMRERLYAFVGLQERTLRRDDAPGVADLLRYAGLFSQRPHSALGLQTLLADAFAPARVQIVECVESWLPIPADQRAALGDMRHALGVECYLGTQCRDANNRLRVELRDLPVALFEALQPGRREHERLRFLIRYYLTEPFDVTVLLELRAGVVANARAGGGHWSALGRDTWLAPSPDAVPRPVSFAV